jgi:hypothetical protein
MKIILEQYKLFNNDDDNKNFTLNETIIEYIINKKIMVYTKINSLDDLLDTKFINYNELTFRYDENNLRIPYLLKEKINAIKVDIENIYNYISSAKIIPYQEIIYGEQIQFLADIVIGSESSLGFNSNNLKYSQKIASINSIYSILPYKTIFVFTHDLQDFYTKFESQLYDKIILSHNSDHEITHIKNIKLHLAQNCLLYDRKLIPIPIGIENNQWFDHQIFNNVREMNIKKTKNIYFFFNLNTHPSRIECFLELHKKLEWNTKRNKENYYKELAAHKYAICPRGNGIDTHRIWECLYLDVIPIIIKSDFMFIDNLPIIVLNNWYELYTITEFKNQELNKITMNYYKNIINKNANIL